MSTKASEVHKRDKDGFYWSEDAEPHLERRKEILKKYPQVRELYGVDTSLKYKVFGLVSLQMITAYFAPNLHWALFLVLAYAVGATLSHALFLAIHELSHHLASKKRAHNNWLAIFANIPMIFPYAMSFKTYHLMHHAEQGDEHHDADLPLPIEAGFFKGLWGKLVWAFNQILCYIIRPMFVHPIKMKKWHIINIVFQFPVIALFIYFAGWGSLLYLAVSVFFAGSLHPLAGHFISEHYVFEEGQETYSYYGPLNKLSFNVGFHNEHHDFPRIPGSRLPKLKKLAPEFYDDLYAHYSWTRVLFKFITNADISLHSRVRRNSSRNGK